MILLGGVTRLTDSELSMVDWRPIMGVVPPLPSGDWLALFEQYKRYPEYQLVNQSMTLAGQGIFTTVFAPDAWTSDRLLFFIPLVVLVSSAHKTELLRAYLPVGLGAQGLMGWYMVQAGWSIAPTSRNTG